MAVQVKLGHTDGKEKGKDSRERNTQLVFFLLPTSHYLGFHFLPCNWVVPSHAPALSLGRLEHPKRMRRKLSLNAKNIYVRETCKT